MESRYRSIVKALTYRAMSLLVTASVAWILTGRAELAALIGVADTGLKLLAYYGHERLWLRLDLGKRPPEYHI